VRRLIPFLVLAAAAHCGRSGEGRPDHELGGLVHSPNDQPAAIQLDRAVKDRGELVRAASLTHAQVSALIGPHQVRGRSRHEVREGTELVEELDDEIAIELDSEGRYHAILNNSKEYGREVFFAGGALYLRPRYGKYHRRAPVDDDEPDRLRSEIFGTVAAHLELLAPGLAVEDGGTAEVGGRAARLVKLSAGKASSPPRQSVSQRAWRESAVVQDVSGELALDAETGVPLRAQVKGAVSFQRDGRSFTMRLESEHQLSALGKVAAISPPEPEKVVADIEQRHELEERESLLKGIAPPSRGAPTP
jgi:hypothetical protein